jgi:hypothetical protein
VELTKQRLVRAKKRGYWLPDHLGVPGAFGRDTTRMIRVVIRKLGASS